MHFPVEGVRLRLLTLSLLATPALLQFGTIQIDWSGEAGDVAIPRVAGLDDEGFESSSHDVVANDDGDPNEDRYEEAWWRDGFAHDSPEDWFAASRAPRAQRPPSLIAWSHSVGTVYKHKLTGAHGVIIGWDARTRAPREWLARNLPGERSWADRLRRLYSPHYSVLEERRKPDGTLQFMQRYIVAQCIEDDAEPCIQVESPPTTLEHPDTSKYFAGFDPLRGYIPNAALAEVYPNG